MLFVQLSIILMGFSGISVVALAAEETEKSIPRLGQTSFAMEDIRSCLEAMCGPPKSYVSTYNLFEKRAGPISETAKNFWQNEIQPLIEAHANSKMATENLISERTAKALGSTLTPDSFHPLLLLLRKNFLFQDFDVEAALVRSDDDDLIRIDEQALKSAVTKLTPEQQAAAIHLTKTVVLPTRRLEAARKFFGTGSSLTARLQLLYPNLSLIKAQQIDASKILSNLSDLKKALDPLTLRLLVEDDQTEIFQRASEGADLNSNDSDRYFEGTQTLESLFGIYLNPESVSLLSKIPLNIYQILVPIRAKFAIMRFFGNQGNSQAQILNFEALNKDSMNCLRRFSASQSLNSSDLQIRKTQETIEELKIASKAALAELWDLENPDSSASIIDEISFKYAENQNVYVNRFKNKLRSWEKRNLEMLSILEDLTDKKTDETLLALMALNLKDSSEDGPRPIKKAPEKSKLQGACEIFPIEGASDNTLLSTGKISVSWFASSYPEFTPSVVAHEIGHIVSNAMRLQYEKGNPIRRFIEARTCVTNRNPFVIEPKNPSKLVDSPWSEEDFADFFSSKVLNQLRKRGSRHSFTKNLGCALVDNRKGTYAGVTGLEPAKNDYHSSGFLRTLLISVERDNVPDLCRKFLAYAPENGRSLVCE